MVMRLFGPAQCGEQCLIGIFMMAVSMYYNKIDMRRMQHAAYAGEKKCINTNFWQEKMKKRDQLENCSVGGTMWTALN
jgi:hypothetical protein